MELLHGLSVIFHPFSSDNVMSSTVELSLGFPPLQMDPLSGSAGDSY